ncbi:hypothetical protein DFR29_101134 [Tahibacter aquaticus]|uniref:Uncharacterized protein n=1 Tax=Tahibacter aquaticus TaxID=520092 RepID=A0A4R6Z9W0_9GAMM|nr:hypothetical protein [Tahibacter aquaticus]TDR48514.1 hypothetical protein DFR29_101134 [Tahibacter aquaticus]
MTPIPPRHDGETASALRQSLLAALLGMAPLLLAADSVSHGQNLSLLIGLVLGGCLALQRLVPPAARQHPAALALIAATAVACAGWCWAALAPASWPALAVLAPLAVANAAWWQGATPQPLARQLLILTVLCGAPVFVGLGRQIAALFAGLAVLSGGELPTDAATAPPALLFIGAACLLALLKSVLQEPTAAARPGPEDA